MLMLTILLGASAGIMVYIKHIVNGEGMDGMLRRHHL